MPEFWAQVLKLYHYPDENNWKFQYDTISTAKRYLKAEKYLSQAQHALLVSRLKYNVVLIVKSFFVNSSKFEYSIKDKSKLQYMVHIKGFVNSTIKCYKKGYLDLSRIISRFEWVQLSRGKIKILN
ncbi:unnamed protein product [Rhizophagus irregularis]|nr:unnamed protein product [Rhizophagus irregularis]